MSIVKNYGYSKSLYKESNGFRIYLYKSWDFTHGYGYFCHIFFDKDFKLGFGFSKNKFRAVKNALLDLN